MVDQAAGGPEAGRHHRVRGPQRGPFPPVEVGGLRLGQPRLVRERQVHQDGHPQPVRPRRRDLGDTAGHQPVQQHDGVVGQLVEDLRETRARGRVRSRPPAGDGHLVDRPAGRGEAVAQPPVVVVSAAGSRGIVDAAGQHDPYRPPGSVTGGGRGGGVEIGHSARS
jgi:hypothetical protein